MVYLIDWMTLACQVAVLQLLSVEDNPGIKQLMLVLRLRLNRLQRTENIGNS